MDTLEVIGLVSAAFVAGFWIGRSTVVAKTPPPAPVPPPPADKLEEIRLSSPVVRSSRRSRCTAM